jgi:hypothetical protein
MKNIFAFLFLLAGTTLHAQEYPFAKNFVAGTIILPDSSVKKGQLKWFPHQNERLRFKENGSGDAQKYGADELLGFTTDSLQFVSVQGIDVVAEEFPAKGQFTHIKHTFAKVLDKGSFNIYFVLTNGYSAFGGNQFYANFLFEKTAGGAKVYAAFPMAVRMREKRYEEAKESLYSFFKDYPSLVEKIKANRQEDDFYAIIDEMKKAN